eukprot:CAMPEP_0197629780 /NCGR_PEP_ID=MMETSP1338-20131121/7502_1 /TAXON_ID=43686 ORGANISM="Pelagodinium beii, Strain RCC1491" /NCGR_SAMPLE_ID=MMETSP1338 /ASSEMBLY_ACC=CAM_ASM_000754 /LENGTH=69 /DNA_ID=CAMNT_0043200879 /DNA_START=379 /DNA_END=588 /DNA_ORIENTATION=-
MPAAAFAAMPASREFQQSAASPAWHRTLFATSKIRRASASSWQHSPCEGLRLKWPELEICTGSSFGTPL